MQCLQGPDAFSLCTTEPETVGEEGGSNTTVIVVVVLGLLVALAVFLAMKYKAKSPEITPSNGNQKSGQEVKPGVKKRKNKHSSSTTGIGEGPGVVKTGEVHGGKKRKRRRKRSSSSPKVGVGSQIQLPKGRQESTKQDSTKETMPGKY